MGATCIQCRIGESYRVLEALRKEDSNLKIFNQTILSLVYGGNLNTMISNIMKLFKSQGTDSVALIKPFEWIMFEEESSLGPESGRTVEESEDSDSESDSGTRGAQLKSLRYVFPLLSWFLSSRRENKQRMILISEGSFPSHLLKLDVDLIVDFFSESRSIDKKQLELRIGPASLEPSSRCICIQGGASSGKSSALFSLDESVSNQAVWLLPHEIVNCELGESPRLVRALFQQASGREFSFILMDDADLLLATSGRIVKEIIEEIGSCISEFRSVRFVFSVGFGAVDSFIMSKVDQFIDLG